MIEGHSTTHAFCETIAASLTHIRALGKRGRCPSGGADTRTLCDLKAEWDTAARFSADAVAKWNAWPYQLCSTCKAMFAANEDAP